MTRVNGGKPVTELDTAPPRMPWVLLCHASGARCGWTATVQRFDQWRPALERRQIHEKLCTVNPLPIIALPSDLMM